MRLLRLLDNFSINPKIFPSIYYIFFICNKKIKKITFQAILLTLSSKIFENLLLHQEIFFKVHYFYCNYIAIINKYIFIFN